MRSYFIVAAITAVTQAQNAASPYLKPSYNASPVYGQHLKARHYHDHSIIHEKPWEQCQRDIDETSDDVNKIQSECKAAVPNISTMMVGLMNLMNQVNSMTVQKDANATVIQNIVGENVA